MITGILSSRDCSKSLGCSPLPSLETVPNPNFGSDRAQPSVLEASGILVQGMRFPDTTTPPWAQHALVLGTLSVAVPQVTDRRERSCGRVFPSGIASTGGHPGAGTHWWCVWQFCWLCCFFFFCCGVTCVPRLSYCALEALCIASGIYCGMLLVFTETRVLCRPTPNTREQESHSSVIAHAKLCIAIMKQSQKFAHAVSPWALHKKFPQSKP